MMKKVIPGHNWQNVISVWSFGAVDNSSRIKLLKRSAIPSLVSLMKIVCTLFVWWECWLLFAYCKRSLLAWIYQNLYSRWTFSPIDFVKNTKLLKMQGILSLVIMGKIVHTLHVWWEYRVVFPLSKRSLWIKSHRICAWCWFLVL